MKKKIIIITCTLLSLISIGLKYQVSYTEHISSKEELIKISDYSEKEIRLKNEKAMEGINDWEDAKIINNHLKELHLEKFPNIKKTYKEQEFNLSHIKKYIKKDGNYLMVLQAKEIKEIKEKEYVKNNVLRFDNLEIIDDTSISIGSTMSPYLSRELYPYKWSGGIEQVKNKNRKKEYDALYILKNNHCIKNIDEENSIFVFMKTTYEESVSKSNVLSKNYFGVIANLRTQDKIIPTKDINIECLKKADFIYQFVEVYDKPEILIFNNQVIDYDETFYDLNIIDNDIITYSNKYSGAGITSQITRYINRFILWDKQKNESKVIMDWGIILPDYPESDDERFHDSKYNNTYYTDSSNKGYNWLNKKYDETYIKFNNELKKFSNIPHPVLKDYISFWHSRNFDLHFDKHGNYFFIDSAPKNCNTKLTKYSKFNGDLMPQHFDEFCENIESFVLKSPKNKVYKNKVFDGVISDLKVSPNGEYIAFIWKDRVVINGEYIIDENYKNINSISFSSKNEEISFYGEKNNRLLLVTINLNEFK